MKIHHSLTKMFAGLAAVALTFVGAAAPVHAAATPLNGQIVPRPLTPTEIATYGLGNAQFSAGLTTVAVGEPVYLDAIVTAVIAPSNIVGVTWSLPSTNRPLSSAAVLTNSPLGANVPIYKMADRYNQAGVPAFQLAGRAFLRPDVVGQYTILATITTTGLINGTNIAPTVTNITTTITAATYLGINACAACHSGSFIGVPSIYPTWTNTPHASFFTRAVDGLVSSHYSANCIQCHVVGYDTNSFANNGGFDDMARAYGWSFPSVLTNGNWAAMPAELQGLANIQCENCHGPGSQHMFSHGITGNTNAISISYGAGACSQCHDAVPQHIKSAEWNNSIHARPTRTPSGANRPACVRCHTAPGFVGYMSNIGNSNGYGTNTVYEAITCQACHDPHDASNPHQLRNSPVTLPDGAAFVTITNAGAGAFCMNCHQGRNGSVTNSTVQYPTAKPTWAGGNSFGPHDGPQSEMLEGVNAVTYGKVIPSSGHRLALTNTCVECHMQTVAATDPAFLQAGGHTFHMTYNVVTNGVTNTVDKVDVCVQCHGPIKSFDMVLVDYNGDGIIEGVQTEVQHLLDRLSTLLPNSSGVVDGLVKTSISTTTNWASKYLNGAYNWQFVNNDGSKGVHNRAYAVGLLKASIGDLTGDNNNDGLPDAWQISYFGAGFATNSAAGPNAVNNSAGVPNWMMSALNLDPHSAFTVAGSGTIFFNGNNIVNGATNTVAIYTAAEIVFNTQVGTSYQIQGISALTGNWQNISTNIPGTGGSLSYVTPTRGNVQMFYRVAHTP
jgi:hypothetical protein